eukprot:TRINITY_DN3138_c0_g1_i1.p1 TRINITY_DN3138_c0_g1~~TRINITY_DN3138_c0_g1_i1.p1  ORF type:complete len:277 (+),score=40.93 TRINITY_DN3138_c0_g1_i1:38-868(+)
MGRKKKDGDAQNALTPEQFIEAAERAQREQQQREQKRREREAADAELARINQMTLAGLDNPHQQTIAVTQPSNRGVQQPIDDTAAADDCLNLLERLTAKPEEPQSMAVAAEKTQAAGFDFTASSHRAKMDARRAQRRSRSSSRRRSNSRSRSSRPRRTQRGRSRSPPRERSPQRARSSQQVRSPPRVRSPQRARSPPRARSPAVRARSPPRVPRRLMYNDGGESGWFPQAPGNRAGRSRSRGRRRSSSRSNSEAKRQAAIRKRLEQWDKTAIGHRW